MDITPLALGTIIVLLSIQGCDSQCTFPSSLWGSWIRERDGRNFTISPSSFQGFNYYSGTQFYNDFRCQSVNGATYVIVQDLPRAYTVDNQFVYLCFSIEVFGANSFLMTDLANISSKISVSDVDLTLVKGFVDIDPTLTALDVCAFQPAEVRSTIMYRSGKGDVAGEMAVTCPSVIHGNYNYTFDGTKCTGNSSFAVCPGRTTVVIDYGQCADQVAYSTSGVLECMGSVTRGANTYLWTWIGTGTFSSTTIRTVCFALEDSSGTVLASYTPQDCLVNQVASSVSPGGLLSMVPLELCPITSEEEGSIAAIAGGAAVGILLLIAVTIVVIVVLMKKRNKKLNTVQADGTKPIGPSKTPTSNGKTPTNGHVKHVTIAAPTVVTTVNETSTSTKKAANTVDKPPEKSKESPSKAQDNPKSESKPSEPTSRPPADPTTAASTTPSTTSVTSAAASSPPAIAVTAAAPPPTASNTPASASAAPSAATADDSKAAVTSAPKTEPTPAADTTAAPKTSETVAPSAAAPTVEPTPSAPAPAAATAADVATTTPASSGSPVKSKQPDPATTEVKTTPEDSSKAPEDKEEKTKKKKKKKKKDKKKSE